MFKPTEYQIKSVATGNVCDDSGWLLDFKGEEKPSLIRAVYAKKQLEVKEENNGLYCYADWLPIKCQLRCDAKPITYKSVKLAEIARIRLGFSSPLKSSNQPLSSHTLPVATDLI